MIEVLKKLKDILYNFSIIDAMIIILIAFLLYTTFAFLKKCNAKKMISYFLLFIFISGIIFIIEKNIYDGIYILIITLGIILCFTIFSSEFKREIWNIKKSKHMGLGVINGNNDYEAVDKCIIEIIKALQNMSKNDMGAIIILSNGNIQQQVLESGVIINSDISSQIIESVFFPKSALHDGAMIINGLKIQAAGCFLPLSQEINLPKELGTRHRAGIGITESINVTAIIVSEETGIISIANQGKIKRYADAEMLKTTLKNYYWQSYLINDKKRGI